MAVATRGPERLSLIHRTVRSVQYAPSIAYRARREDRKARGQHEPGGQSKAERFIRTLKQEEAVAKTYVDLEDARRQTGPFYEEVYNIERLRSALSHELRSKTSPKKCNPPVGGRGSLEFGDARLGVLEIVRGYRLGRFGEHGAAFATRTRGRACDCARAPLRPISHEPVLEQLVRHFGRRFAPFEPLDEIVAERGGKEPWRCFRHASLSGKPCHPFTRI